MSLAASMVVTTSTVLPSTGRLGTPIMFGTLVSTDSNPGTLEFVKNPDPVAAVSRNSRDKIHTSCMSCRSRKVRCSGGQKACQRCVAMGLECVYPENLGRNKRQQKNKSRPETSQSSVNVPTQIVCDEATPCAKDGPERYDEELALEDLHDITFNDNCMNESLFTPWILDTPMQYSLDGESSSSSSGDPTSAADLTISESPFSTSRSTVAVPPSQLPELSAADASLTSLRNRSTTDSACDLESRQGPLAACGNISWALNAGDHGMVDATSEPLTLDPWGKTRRESDSCTCLVSAILFLEKLVSRSTSREDRIDLLLTDVRNSIETLEKFMECEICAGRAEQNTLLSMAALQIGIICGKTANCYKAMRPCGLSETNSSRQMPEFDTSIDIYVSTYRVNRRERLHLLRSLLTLQIRDFQEHIDIIKARYHTGSNQETLVEAENHIKLAQVTINSHP